MERERDPAIYVTNNNICIVSKHYGGNVWNTFIIPTNRFFGKPIFSGNGVGDLAIDGTNKYLF